jgi:lipid-A-disaccharide synthase
MARIFLSAGEASGELYAVQLMAALREKLPDAGFYGLGGERMAAAGFERVVRAEDVAVMGITEILRHVPKIYREYRKLRRSLDNPKPDIAVLIDFPDVNLGLAKRCKQLGIPVIFFVSPQVWAWKRYRLLRIRRDVDRMLVIFPFEEPWYRERGVQASFVGHPLAELPLPSVTREAFAADNRLDTAKQWVAILPGSRAGEIELNLPEILAAVTQLARETPDRFEFVLPLAPTLTAERAERMRAVIAQTVETHPEVVIRLSTDARAALHHARASIVASGTATLEAALIGSPFVVVYRLSGASYAVAKRFVKVPHVAMANLIAGARVVPELIQHEFTGANVAAALRPLLDETPERAAMQQALARIRLSLCEDGCQDGSAIEKVAGHVLSLLHASQSHTSQTLSPAL